ncbi:hypothetical protein P2G88_04290 [Aliiglaciecola sp. CAU 1673]|uniref:Ig-like domain-containing protein n=1 Tax=Aliiglaciecola sp. CAU 1673 TaxID=3032595 RepID=UPI0023DC1DE4|nr:hypothetical protein [Aliiglaciecola sp. CAU 1673]MDF2177464.1 hypothetical protein [Aliiglaciecola sp. CAU 1673]
MKAHSIACLLLATLLYGCGGGSSSNDTSTPSTPNSAPTLSGLFSLNTKARVEGLLVIDAKDSDGDNLSVSFTEKPDWLSYDFNQNQLTLKANAGFFDIGSHSLQVTVSDGKASTSYPLNIEVEDNPDQYQNINLGRDNFTGHWVLESGHQVHLFEDYSGVFVDNDKQPYPLSWSVNYGFIDIRVMEPGCQDCTMENLEIEALVKEGNRYRLHIASNKRESFTTNTLVPSTYAPNKAMYGDPQSPAGFALSLDLDLERSVLEGRLNYYINVEWNALRSASYSGSYHVSLAAFGNATGIQLNSSTGTAVIENYTLRVPRRADSRDVEIAVNFILSEAEILFADTALMIMKTTIKPELTDEFSGTNLAEYDGLEHFLQSSFTSVQEFSLLTPTEAPQIAVGSTYASRFTIPAAFENYPLLKSANRLIIDDAQSARLETRSIDGDILSIPINWSRQQNSLTLSHAGQSTTYQFYLTLAGDRVATGFNLLTESNEVYTYFYSFEEAQPISLSSEQLQGRYQHLSFLKFDGWQQDHMKLAGNNKGDYYHYSYDAEPRGFWTLNADDSFNLVNYRSSCAGADSYEECVSIIQNARANGEFSTLVRRKLTPYKIEGDKHYFWQELQYDLYDETIQSASLVIMTKKASQ